MTAPRLLKVRLQAIYVAEVDGEMTEMASAPMEVPAAQWRTLDPAELADSGASALAAQLAPQPAPPNRQQRRAAAHKKSAGVVKKASSTGA